MVDVIGGEIQNSPRLNFGVTKTFTTAEAGEKIYLIVDVGATMTIGAASASGILAQAYFERRKRNSDAMLMTARVRRIRIFGTRMGEAPHRH